MQQTAGRELLLAASLLARPEFVSVLFPKGDTTTLTNALAREAIAVLATQGPAYATPGALEAALVDRGALDEDNLELFAELVRARPLRDEVQLPDLLAIKAQVDEEASNRRLAHELRRIAADISGQPGETAEAMSLLRRALHEHQTRGSGRDPSAASIVTRMAEADNNTRWKMGCPMFDEPVEGIGPDGQFGYGALGQGETSTVLAQYGVGKTRLLYNEASVLLDQGANISIVALEDSDTAYLAKLIGVKFGVRKALIHRFAKDKSAFLAHYGEERAAEVEQGLSWAQAMRPRLRIYDERTKHRLSKFEVLMNTLEEDAALYGTTHVFIDYLQAAVKSPDIAVVEERVQDIRAFAGRNNVHVQLISQLSNDTIKNGAPLGMVAAKGGGEVGQIVHFAWEVQRDPEIGQRELKVIQQKGRDAGMNVAYAEMDEATGKIVRWKGTADFFGGGGAGELKPTTKRGSKK